MRTGSGALDCPGALWWGREALQRLCNWVKAPPASPPGVKVQGALPLFIRTYNYVVESEEQHYRPPPPTLSRPPWTNGCGEASITMIPPTRQSGHPGASSRWK